MARSFTCLEQRGTTRHNHGGEKETAPCTRGDTPRLDRPTLRPRLRHGEMAACDGDQRGVDLAMYCLLGNDLISDRAAHPAAIPMPPATCVCDTPGCIEQGQSVLHEANRVGLLPVVKQSVFVHNTSTFPHSPSQTLPYTTLAHASTHIYAHKIHTRARRRTLTHRKRLSEIKRIKDSLCESCNTPVPVIDPFIHVSVYTCMQR